MSSQRARGALEPLAGYWTTCNIALALVLVAMPFLACVGTSVINHDNALYLDLARRLVAGKMPYVDFVDTNPPLVIYLNAIPAWIEVACGVPIEIAFRLCVTVVGVLSLLCVRLIIRRSVLDRLIGESVFAFLLAGELLFLLDYNYGQREHLFVLFYLPLLFCRWSRSAGAVLSLPLAVVIGLAGGVGLAIKPHFLVVAILVEAYRLLRNRDPRNLLRPEVAGLFVVLGIYAIHFLFIPEPMRQALLGRWLPAVMEHYGLYGESIWSAVRNTSVWSYVLVASAAWFVRPASSSAGFDELARTFVVFTVLGVGVVYFGQQKYWHYHLVPAKFGAFFGFAMMVVQAFQMHAARPADASATGRFAVGLKPLIFVLLAAILLMNRDPWFLYCAVLTAGAGAALGFARERLAGSALGSMRLRAAGIALVPVAASLLVASKAVIGPPQEPASSRAFGKVIMEQTTASDTVLVLSTSVVPAYPTLLLLGRKQASRYTVAFPFAFHNAGRRRSEDGSFPYPDRSSLGEGEARFIRELGEDVAKYRPKVVFVSRGPSQACPPGFQVSDYLDHLGFLVEEMSGYERSDSIEGFLVFVRK